MEPSGLPPSLLAALGFLLSFFLLNIEVADFFSTGTVLQFQFSGNFGRDTTYSLTWGLYALLVLCIGIRRDHVAARYGGLGLMILTILKLFCMTCGVWAGYTASDR